jgi:cell wall-associated NlpC family hydrolase
MTVRQRFATIVLASALLCGGGVAIDTSSASASRLPARSVAATAAAEQVATTAAAALAVIGTDQFAGRLEVASYAVSMSLAVDSTRLRQAWAAADRPHQVALLSALAQVGVRYRRNASNPGVAFDCSGLTSYAWEQAGVAIPHQSSSQIRAAAVRKIDTAQAGDLVYYPGHVMMYLGVDNFIVHAVGTGRYVEVDEITNRLLGRTKLGDPTV